jgi:hypothetical protein
MSSKFMGRTSADTTKFRSAPAESRNLTTEEIDLVCGGVVAHAQSYATGTSTYSSASTKTYTLNTGSVYLSYGIASATAKASGPGAFATGSVRVSLW